MSAKQVVNNIAEDDDPQVVLTFNGKDDEKVTLTVTVTIEGDARKVWEELADLSERAAVHEVAKDIFLDLTRDVAV